ncbi:MAG: zf-HC2 domain-containing protein [Kofleriaceae bacterium]|nr:zf-HC2 domain-containing protein [Kofleriaceae bacterium]
MAEPPVSCDETARYFDGEVAVAREAAVLEHLAGCARCQAELGDLAGIDVALRQAPAAATAPPPRRGRAPLVALVAVGARAAAAAAAVWVAAARSAPARRRALTLALADTRAVEVRWSAAALDRHRPYDVALAAAAPGSWCRWRRWPSWAARRAGRAGRGPGPGRDLELALGELALQQRHLPALLAGLAALALLAGRPADALAAADRALAAAPSPAARWNRARALRDLGLPATAAAELEAVAAAGEAGWSDEAGARARALAAPVRERLDAFARWSAAAAAMVAHTGPPLSAEQARARPGLARLYFLDALRGATTRDEVLALAPLAAALDEVSGHDGASAAVTRTAALDLKVRGPLAAAYRQLVTGQLAPDDALPLLARLERAGAAATDLKVGALVVLGLGPARADELAAHAARTGDPWFALLATEQRALGLLHAGDRPRAEVLLLEAHAGCDARAWAYRCAKLAEALAELYSALPMYPEAERWARAAERGFAADGAVGPEDNALAQVAELRRARQQGALARATFAEIRARAGDGQAGCLRTRYAELGLALLDIQDGAPSLTAPAPDACDEAPADQEVGFMVNRALMTGRTEDRERARAWIAAARAAGAADLAELAAARLEIEAPGAAARLQALAPRFTGLADAHKRTWLVSTQIDEAGRREAWAEVVTLAAAELGAPAPARCALVASADDDAHRGRHRRRRALAGARRTFARPGAWRGDELVPPALRGRLAGCDRVDVHARPPLRRRADLLPPELPWAFVTRARRRRHRARRAAS